MRNHTMELYVMEWHDGITLLNDIIEVYHGIILVKPIPGIAPWDLQGPPGKPLGAPRGAL